MKYISYIIRLISVLLCVTGCEDASRYMTNDWSLSANAHYLIIEQETLTSDAIPAVGGQHSISFTSSDKWSATTNSNWVTLQPASGEMGKSALTIIAAENTDIMDRYDTTYITPANDHLQPYRIITKQEGIYHLMVDKTTIEVGNVATTESLSIISNDTWSVTSSVSWITVTPSTGTGDKKLSISIAESIEPLERTGIISITGRNSESRVIKVSQQGIGYYLTVDPLTLSVGSGSLTKTLSIKTNDSWSVSSMPNWISTSTMSGTGDRNLSVNISANTGPETRTGMITITGANTPAVTITVSQSGVGYNLSVDKTVINVGAGSTTESFTITSNDSWTISTSASWARPTTTSGSGNKSISLEIDKNANTEARDATITIQHSHGNSSTTVKVHQSEGGRNDITIEDFEDPIPLN